MLVCVFVYVSQGGRGVAASFFQMLCVCERESVCVCVSVCVCRGVAASLFQTRRGVVAVCAVVYT